MAPTRPRLECDAQGPRQRFEDRAGDLAEDPRATIEASPRASRGVRPVTTTIVLLALLLAGCTGAVDAPPADARAVASGATMEFESCEHILIFLLVPASDAAALLPEGFEPDVLVGDLAQQLVMATRCDALGNATDSGFTEVMSALAVIPPEELAHESAPFHLVLLGLATTSADALARYHAWNATVAEQGDATLTFANGAGSVSTSFGGAPFEATIAVGQHASDVAGSLRSFLVEHRALVGAIDYAWPDYQIASGAAAVTTGAGQVGGPDAGAGQGYHEQGDGYGLTLRPWALPGSL